MSLAVRPSKLIEWARCQLRAQHRTMKRRQRNPDPVAHIATWIGNEVHAQLAGRALSEIPRHVAFDSITPNKAHAATQVDRIVDAVLAEMMARWWRKYANEVEVGTEQPFQGTIDLFFNGHNDPTVDGWAIADIKTGQLSDGVWLQLGAYMNAFVQSPPAWAGLIGPITKVVLVHAPRTSLDEEQKCEVVVRNAEKCRVAAKLLADIAYNVVHDGWTPVPMPGRHCSGCEVLDCAVRAQ